MCRRSFPALAGFMMMLVCGLNDVPAQVSVESNVQSRQVRGKTVPSERDEQEALFNYHFRDQKLKYETRLSSLKAKATVPAWRTPYSGWLYPQTSGGMSDAGSRGGGWSPLSTYDRAFNGGRNSANGYEARRVLGGDRAFLPRLRMRRVNEGWEGYCSGLTASTIRHPEPVHPVDAGQVGGTPGVVFQPAEIKALLTSIYNRTTDDSYLYLAPPSASDGGPNMGTFHLALANYIGQAEHPIGIDRTKGRAAWNNPIYAYEVTSITDAGHGEHLHYKVVDTTVTYSYYSSDEGRQTEVESGEVQANQRQTASFRYLLGLDDEGRIVGGSALSDGGYFLWVPLYAVQGKEDGTAPGNPYLDVRKVLALARASALPQNQSRFDKATIGPTVDPAVTALAQETPASANPQNPQNGSHPQ